MNFSEWQKHQMRQTKELAQNLAIGGVILMIFFLAGIGLKSLV